MNGKLPEGWELKYLEDVVEVLDKHRIPLKQSEREKRIKNKKKSCLVPYYGATGQVGWIDDYLFNEELILLGEDGAPFFEPMKEKSYIVTGKSWVNNHAHVLRAKKDVALAKYICQYLNIFNYNRYISGTTRLKLNQSKMRKIPIPIPSIRIQHKIVNTIKKAERLIECRNKSDLLYEEYLKSLFNHLSKDKKGYKKIELKDIARITMGQSPTGASYNTKELGMPLLNGPTEFGKIHPVEKQWSSEPKKIAKEGSILFCVRGATAGRINWADKDYCIGRGIASIDSGNKGLNEYIYQYLKLKYSYFQNVGIGSTFINIDKKTLSNLEIQIADEKIISRYLIATKKVDLINRYTRNSNEQINKILDLLIQSAFKGELIK